MKDGWKEGRQQVTWMKLFNRQPVGVSSKLDVLAHNDKYVGKRLKSWIRVVALIWPEVLLLRHSRPCLRAVRHAFLRLAFMPSSTTRPINLTK